MLVEVPRGQRGKKNGVSSRSHASFVSFQSQSQSFAGLLWDLKCMNSFAGRLEYKLNQNILFQFISREAEPEKGAGRFISLARIPTQIYTLVLQL